MKQSAKLLLLVAALTTWQLSVVPAEAATIIWHWGGEVTGHTDPGTGRSLETVVPLGTRVDVKLSFDPDAPFLNPSSCLQGTASASLEVLGRTYTNGGFVWVDAMGFGPGVCAPQYNWVEVVVPSWGVGGPSLPDGWVPFGSSGMFLPGLWWGGDLSSGQPASISSQLPLFYVSREAVPQRFMADLRAVEDMQTVTAPEPATWILMGTGLAAAWRRRRRP